MKVTKKITESGIRLWLLCFTKKEVNYDGYKRIAIFLKVVENIFTKELLKRTKEKIVLPGFEFYPFSIDYDMLKKRDSGGLCLHIATISYQNEIYSVTGKIATEKGDLMGDIRLGYVPKH
ncbi:MAG: hypothetical protein WCI77_06815 [Candidatus Omnitrophota bacterium]